MILKILQRLKQRNFLTPIFSNNSKNVIRYRLGNLGLLLGENVRSEWLASNITDKDLNVFYYDRCASDNSCDPCADALKACGFNLPIAVADIHMTSDPQPCSFDKEEDYYFIPTSRTELSITVLLSMSEALQYFLRWQRKRKMWWSKVSTSPGRYMLSDSKLDNDATTALILSQYPWGKQIAETISVQPSTYTSEKHTHIWTVKSTTSLEWALLNLLCDSAVDSILERNVLRLHRKMAPYKCALAVDFTDESNYDQLSQLAFYLSLKLRQSGICTFLPSDLKVQLGTQLSLNDECGTPYTIIVNNDTLKTGVTEFYNRDTTWREKIHVSDITSYTQKLFSNF